MSFPATPPWSVGVVGLKEAKVGVLKLGLRAFAKALPQGERTSGNFESCLGVSKELRKKDGDVGVLVGVGGSPPE